MKQEMAVEKKSERKRRGRALKFREREEKKVRSRRTSDSIGRGWKTDRPPAKTGFVQLSVRVSKYCSVLVHLFSMHLSTLDYGYGYSDCLVVFNTPSLDMVASIYQDDSHVQSMHQSDLHMGSDFLLIWLNLGQFNTGTSPDLMPYRHHSTDTNHPRWKTTVE